TLHDALEKFARYSRIVSDAGSLIHAIDPKVAHVSRLFPKKKSARFVQLGDEFLAILVLRARQATGVDLVPNEVRFQHGAPSSTVEEDRLFRAPLRFDHWSYQLVFDPELLSLPLLHADSKLARVLDRYAGEILERLPTRDQTVAAVRGLIAEHLRGGCPD